MAPLGKDLLMMSSDACKIMREDFWEITLTLPKVVKYYNTSSAERQKTVESGFRVVPSVLSQRNLQMNGVLMPFIPSISPVSATHTPIDSSQIIIILGNQIMKSEVELPTL